MAHRSEASSVLPAGADAPAASLRARRQELVERVLRGELDPGAFPTLYAGATDTWLQELFGEASGGRSRGLALLGVGGYGRGLLAPGSDLDLVLLHRVRRGYDKVAKTLWYRIWDLGIHLDHSVRTRSEALSMARSDLKVVLGLLDGRLIAGDEGLASPLLEEVAQLWRREAPRKLRQLEESATARHQQSGELAFLLEPDLKQSLGGLRDVAVLRALAAGFPEVASLAESDAVARAETLLMRARVALHCKTGSTSDRLLLQEQDQIAALLSFRDADALMAAVAESARTVSAALGEGMRRARLAAGGSAQRGEAPIGPGLVLRDGEVALSGPLPEDVPAFLLHLAATAATRHAPIERESLEKIAAVAKPPPTPWPRDVRDTFVELLSTGDALVPVVEALDQYRLFELYLPEWSAVRNRPQRNAYHRFTVDRHLLEAVARASEHLADVDRPDLLVLGALLHDLGKGYVGDHSEVGTELTETIAWRMGFPPRDVEVLTDLVAYHLVLPEFATRRDLDDPSTAGVVAKVVGNRTTLGLLAALTEADSRATGTQAWGQWKAELVASLVERVATVLEGGTVEYRPPEPSPDERQLLEAGRLALRASGRRVTVVAPDRPGLFAAVTGVLALSGCNVRRATASQGAPGMAIEVFDVEPAFDRMPDWERVERDIAAALDGRLALEEQLAKQDATYARGRRPVAAHPPQVRVMIDNDTSARASILEVRAPDRLGLLHRVTAELAARDLDVVSALVDTLGHEVIDTFYVRDRFGEKLSDPDGVASLVASIEAVVADVA